MEKDQVKKKRAGKMSGKGRKEEPVKKLDAMIHVPAVQVKNIRNAVGQLENNKTVKFIKNFTDFLLRGCVY